MRIDIHAHSSASDGTELPADLVRSAAAAGLDVVALTDHDTTSGWAAAVEALPAGLTLVRGAEISCEIDGVSMHLLAYLFDPAHEGLAEEMGMAFDDRTPRAKAIIAKLAGRLPRHLAGRGRPARAGRHGRPAAHRRRAGRQGHRARPQHRVHRAAAQRREVLRRPLLRRPGPGDRARPGSRWRPGVRPPGRVAPWRHRQRRRDPQARGGRARPVSRSTIGTTRPTARVRLRAMAAELGLLVTGASDYHGTGKPNLLGENTTDPEVFAALVEQATGVDVITA